MSAGVGRAGGRWNEPAPPGKAVNALRRAQLWSGGRATAGIAMGVAAVGFLLIRGVARVPIFGHDMGTFLLIACGYIVAAALLALGATEVMRILLRKNTPRPRIFFGWISAVVIAVVFLLPFVFVHPLAERFGLAFVNLITATTIAVLEGVSASAVSDEPVRPPHLDPPRSIDGR